MYVFKFFFIAALFFVIAPGIFVRIPAKGSKKMVAAVHSLVFASVVGIIMYFWKPTPTWAQISEGLVGGAPTLAVPDATASEDTTTGAKKMATAATGTKAIGAKKTAEPVAIESMAKKMA